MYVFFSKYLKAIFFQGGRCRSLSTNFHADLFKGTFCNLPLRHLRKTCSAKVQGLISRCVENKNVLVVICLVKCRLHWVPLQIAFLSRGPGVWVCFPVYSLYCTNRLKMPKIELYVTLTCYTTLFWKLVLHIV